MKTSGWVVAIVAALALGMAPAPAPAQAQAQAQAKEPSLADLARQQKERKKAGTSARVVTNDDLPESGGVSTVGPDAPAPADEAEVAEGAAGAAAEAGSEAGVEGEKTEESPELQVARQELADRQQAEETARGSIRRLERLTEETEDPRLRQQYQDMLNLVRRNLEGMVAHRKDAESKVEANKPKPAKPPE